MGAGGGQGWKDARRRAVVRLRGFAGHSRGGISVIMALGLLVLALLVAGGIEMADLVSERAKLRNVADSAALWGASSIALTGEDDGADQRTKAFAESQLASTPLRMSATVEAQVVDLGTPDEPKPALKVIIRGQRDSFFGNLFPPGGFKVSVASTALSVSRVPLCILAHGTKDAAKEKDTSNVVAGGCLVHSNADLRVDSGAKIEAGLAQAVNTASGPIDPDANSGAKAIADPFAKLDINTKGTCPLALPLVYELGIVTLPAGRHCGDIKVAKNATLRLAAGEHIFVHSKLELQENSGLEGTAGSVLIFDKDSTFDFKDGARVNLVGMKTGAYAGFLIVGARDNTHDFRIAADNVENLLGTIYVPNARLVVEGKKDVARDSAWTVIVAKQVELKGDPTLVMNTDYEIGGVPVPAGVGAKTRDTRIVE